MTTQGEDCYTSGLRQNKDWAANTAKAHPDLFPALAQGQKPEILWLGCSDSRCPETTILGLKPGDVFVHRNIANVLHPGDLSSQAVIAYAVGVLKVKHIVLAGHTGCGGAAAALGNKSLGLLDAWLHPLKQLRAKNQKAWEGLDDKERALKLIEANVRMGVDVLRQNGTVVEGMMTRGVQVHGVIYNVGTGHLEEVDVSEKEEDKKVRESVFGTN